MTEAIDWSAPLEAYHPDGRVMLVRAAEWMPLRWQYDIKPSLDGVFSFYPHGGHQWSQWRIRNRKTSEGVTPELVERMAANIAAWSERYGKVPDWRLRPDSPDQSFVTALNEARAILAEYEAATKPPVDPLVEKARQIIAEAVAYGRRGDPEDKTPEQFLNGDCDEGDLIRRVVELAKADTQ